MKSLFYQYCKGEYHWPRWERPEELPVGPHSPTSRYRLESKNGAMCLLITTGKEPEWQRICGFELLRVEGVYQFDEADCGTPYVKIICRNLVNPVGEGIYYLAAEDKQRDPPMNYQFCDTEVLVDDGKLKTTADVKNLFKSFNVNLQSTIMIPDMLSCWLEQKQQDHEWPPTTTCIVRFGESVPHSSPSNASLLLLFFTGRQEDNSFVAGNVVMKDGVFLSLEVSKKSIQPAFFKNSVLPLTKKDFPRNMIIPQCHVRFVVGMRFWADLMPQFFANNLMPARATFAMSVMGLYASKIWGGETGFGHGMPFAWVYSSEPSTGKH